MSDGPLLVIRQSISCAYSAYLREWEHCFACNLRELRSRTVHVRGKLPCSVLFIGEAPGEAEDALGYPFMGESGQLLDSWLSSCGFDDIRSAFITTVACIPFRNEAPKPPAAECLKACRPRFDHLVALANPQRVVCVGKVATTYLSSPKRRHKADPPLPYVPVDLSKLRVDHIPHPQAYLRADRVRAAQYEKQASLALRRIASECR